MDFIDEARKMCRSSGRASDLDVDLLVEILGKLKTHPVIVQLGAGAIFTVTVLGAKPNARLYSIDNDMHPFYHEDRALTNCGVIDSFNRIMVLADCIEAAGNYEGPKVDLLILDSDHSYESVLASLKAWAPHMKETHYVFLHDYEAQGRGARFPEPGVKKACDEFFKSKYTWREGWSAAWEIKENIPKPDYTPIVPVVAKKRKAKKK